MTVPYAAMHSGRAVLQFEGFDVEKVAETKLKVKLRESETQDDVIRCLGRYHITGKCKK